MNRYERVTFRPEGATRPSTVILRLRDATSTLLIGIEVDHEGDEVAPKGVDERLHVIDLALMRKRVPLKWDLVLGVLVPA